MKHFSFFFFFILCKTSELTSLNYFDSDWDISFSHSKKPINIQGALSIISAKKQEVEFKLLLLNHTDPLEFLSKSIKMKSNLKDSILVHITSSLDDDDNDDGEVYEKIDKQKRSLDDILFNAAIENEKNATFVISLPFENAKNNDSVYDGKMWIGKERSISLSLSKRNSSSSESSESSSSLKVSSHLYDVLSFFNVPSHEEFSIHLRRKAASPRTDNMPLLIAMIVLGFGYVIHQYWDAFVVCFKKITERKPKPKDDDEDDSDTIPVTRRQDSGGYSAYRNRYTNLTVNPNDSNANVNEQGQTQVQTQMPMQTEEEKSVKSGGRGGDGNNSVDNTSHGYIDDDGNYIE